ncbi:MAG: type II toxin-antitoxin system RelE/ParE family toxin [Acidobacteriota bacterium]|nr:type II toxin-antitoxin system RelE/ParE family toxin [Acidobacteriota bacterium]
MFRIDVSVEAEEDIDEIADYTTRTWGWRQTDQYLAKLEDCFGLLVRNPAAGRRCEFIRPGLYRFEIGKHVVSYIPRPAELLIVRVLHQQMVPAKSRFEE